MDTAPARQRFDSFDAALEAFRAPVENRSEMRLIARVLGATRFEIPPSARYVSASRATGRVLAYFSKGLVELAEGNGAYRRIDMPVSFPRSASDRRHAHGQVEDVCPVHQTQLPATRRCDACDD